MDVVCVYFCFEFLNCLDEIIIFDCLGCVDMDGIVDIQFVCLIKWFVVCKIEIFLDEDVCKWLVDEGYDLVFGVWLLKWVIQCVL